MRRLALAATLAALLPHPGGAHPHVFVDAGIDFIVGESGRLERLRITWIYDAFSSLYVLESLGFDADADGRLTAEERAFLVKDQTEWIEGFEGDSYLFHSGAKLALGGPENADVVLEDGRIRVSFERGLAAPAPDDGPDLIAKTYDPSYYYAYTLIRPPEVEGPGAERCRATLVPFVLDGMLGSLQQSLAELSADETPEQQDVGALFADEARLSCD